MLFPPSPPPPSPSPPIPLSLRRCPWLLTVRLRVRLRVRVSLCCGRPHPTPPTGTPPPTRDPIHVRFHCTCGRDKALGRRGGGLGPAPGIQKSKAPEPLRGAESNQFAMQCIFAIEEICAGELDRNLTLYLLLAVSSIIFLKAELVSFNGTGKEPRSKQPEPFPFFNHWDPFPLSCIFFSGDRVRMA